MAIPILEVEISQKDKLFQVLENAIDIMTKELIMMEKKDYTHKAMLEKCVWPILEQLSEKYEAIKNDKEIELNDFYII